MSRGPAPLLVARVADQVDGVLIDEGAGGRFPLGTRAVGLTGTFDPQEGVDVSVSGRRGGRGAEGPAARVAPRHVAIGRSGAVARGVDHVVRPAGHARDRVAV